MGIRPEIDSGKGVLSGTLSIGMSEQLVMDPSCRINFNSKQIPHHFGLRSFHIKTDSRPHFQPAQRKSRADALGKSNRLVAA